MAGGALGSLFGMGDAGRGAGSNLGAAVSKWLGAGDYNVSHNSIVNSLKASGSIPMMHNDGQTILVRHKEFLCEVKPNTSFQVQRSFRINPGSATTFPWLARLANCYQQYRIKGMVYHYVPTSGASVSSTNTSLGSVMMQTSYRSNDTAPNNKIELLNEYWSSEAVPSESFCHPVECNPNENPFNVQYVAADGATLPTGDSPLLYDLGTTHLAVSGQQGTLGVLGDLWVTYEIELKKPIIDSNVTDSAFKYGTYFNAPPASFSNPFGVGVAQAGNLKFTTDTGRSINIPANQYGTFWIFILYKPAATFTTANMTGAPVVTNCDLVFWSGTTDRIETNIGAATSGNIVYMIRVNKLQREVTAGIQVPTASTTAGTFAAAEITMWGATDMF